MTETKTSPKYPKTDCIECEGTGTELVFGDPCDCLAVPATFDKDSDYALSVVETPRGGITMYPPVATSSASTSASTYGSGTIEKDLSDFTAVDGKLVPKGPLTDAVRVNKAWREKKEKEKADAERALEELEALATLAKKRSAAIDNVDVKKTETKLRLTPAEHIAAHVGETVKGCGWKVGQRVQSQIDGKIGLVICPHTQRADSVADSEHYGKVKLLLSSGKVSTRSATTLKLVTS